MKQKFIVCTNETILVSDTKTAEGYVVKKIATCSKLEALKAKLTSCSGLGGLQC